MSEDILLLLERWANEKQFSLPPRSYFHQLRAAMRMKLRELFPGSSIEFVPEEVLRSGIASLTNDHSHGGVLPVVSLDRVYCGGGHPTVESTRLVDRRLRPSGVGSRTDEPLEVQFARIAQRFAGERNRAVQLVDDVIFSSKSIAVIVRQLGEFGIRVVRVVAGITINQAVRDLAETFPEIEVRSVVAYESVVDEVCERDFYPGVPLSGRLLGENGLPYLPERGAPYVLPFGRPNDWATIPQEREADWSAFCLSQTIGLWEAIERASGRLVHCSDVDRLPAANGDPFPGGVPFVEYLKRFTREEVAPAP